MRTWIALLAAAALLTGCATWTLVDGGARQDVAGGYSVEPQVAWSRIRQGGVELWTVDGPALQALRFFEPIGDGDPLFAAQGSDELPVFSSHMTASEIQEFVVHSTQRGGGARVAARELRPWRLGSLEGFRFELDFLNESGLEMTGIVAGAVAGEKLYLIAYTGARAHYFPKYATHVERLLASVRIGA